MLMSKNVNSDVTMNPPITRFQISLETGSVLGRIDLVTVFDAILTSRQTCEKLQCLYENRMSNNFRKTAVLKKISIVN